MRQNDWLIEFDDSKIALRSTSFLPETESSPRKLLGWCLTFISNTFSTNHGLKVINVSYSKYWEGWESYRAGN